MGVSLKFGGQHGLEKRRVFFYIVFLWAIDLIFKEAQSLAIYQLDGAHAWEIIGFAQSLI